MLLYLMAYTSRCSAPAIWNCRELMVLGGIENDGLELGISLNKAFRLINPEFHGF